MLALDLWFFYSSIGSSTADSSYYQNANKNSYRKKKKLINTSLKEEPRSQKLENSSLTTQSQQTMPHLIIKEIMATPKGQSTLKI